MSAIDLSSCIADIREILNEGRALLQSCAKSSTIPELNSIIDDLVDVSQYLAKGKTVNSPLDEKLSSLLEECNSLISSLKALKTAKSDNKMESLKWIILDGDIDPEWIESMNTVMDDNKVLTLASNERIPLKPSMRLLFEIGSLRYANPSTVSRAGILFINEHDVGWSPYVRSWIDKRPKHEHGNLLVLFDKMVQKCLDELRTDYKFVCHVSDITRVYTLCRILGAVLDNHYNHFKIDVETTQFPADLLEGYFVFSLVWGFAGALLVDSLENHRDSFDKWFKIEWYKALSGQAKFPTELTVFDWSCLPGSQPRTIKWTSWSDLTPEFTYTKDLHISQLMVHSSETTRVRFLMDLMIHRQFPVLLVGSAGTGKTLLVNDYLQSLDEEQWLSKVVNFNYYTDSSTLQTIIESQLERKAGRNYGPPGTRKLVFFVDDLNMPEVDTYGTQSPITLLRQHLDCQHFYDRQKLTLKVIQNVQLVAAMNPTAGSFDVNPRLKRHFATFGVNPPSLASMKHIYGSIVKGYFSTTSFTSQITNLTDNLLDFITTLHEKVSLHFLPTAIKFHYQFNLRDLSNTISNLLSISPNNYSTPASICRLLFSEAKRVYGDRLVDYHDLQKFEEIISNISSQIFGDLSSSVTSGPHLFSYFNSSSESGIRQYTEIKGGFDSLKTSLEDVLENYSAVKPAMPLVFFHDAMEHILRISRVFERPRGSVLLVGVGGSGKQSLTRLAAFMSEMEVKQITLTASYSVSDFLNDLKLAYLHTGTKEDSPLVFLLTDFQIVDEKFLVFINDFLSTGDIPNLFADDEIDQICDAVRSAVKETGLLDTKHNCYNFFINRVRSNLHLSLCFSPVGDSLRVRCRKFPTLVNCTTIDWFHGWPRDALVSVAASRFDLADGFNVSDPKIVEDIVQFMAHVHVSTNEMAEKFKTVSRRHAYTTPKSFLELIDVFLSMLKKKRSEVQKTIDRLESGLIKLNQTSSDVDQLKIDLEAQKVVVEGKKEAAARLLEQVAKETQIVEAEQNIANKEAEKCAEQETHVSAVQRDCEKDLERALPAVEAAEAALNTLNKPNLTELKSLPSPPPDVARVMEVVIILLTPPGKPVQKDLSWGAAKKLMNQVDQFLNQLKTYDKENIPANALAAVRSYLADENFNGPFIATKSSAAAGICEWARNVVVFYDIHCEVEPKRQRLAEANAKLEESRSKLNAVKARVEKLERRLGVLQDQFEEATLQKNEVIAAAAKTQERLDLANRLVNGLASEKVRWADSVDKLKIMEENLLGDVLLAASFVSYIGPFNRQFRHSILHEHWIPFLKNTKIPVSEHCDPLSLFTDEAMIASWANEGLPTDTVSVENAAIVSACDRWPLLIDPQLQGISWLRNHLGERLKVVRLNQSKYLDIIERAIQDGDPVIIENIGEDIDAVLDPIIQRNITTKGRVSYIKIGDKELEFDPKFRLFIQTKLSNPHYRPELQAQTTLINFMVTEDGLEEQLLAEVVQKEKPELEEQKASLIRQQNEFKITLKSLEDSLLQMLSQSEGDILTNITLINNLEKTKVTALEIEQKVRDAKLTEESINATREFYRPVANRSSMLYFLLSELSVVDNMYQFSLRAFVNTFHKAIDRTEASADVAKRVTDLVESITFAVFAYASRGLFERHKLILSAQLCFKILLRKGELIHEELDYLIRGTKNFSKPNPLSWLDDQSWAALVALSQFDEFKRLSVDVESGSKRWKEWFKSPTPESTRLPQDYAKKTEFQKLMILRALRPDRLTLALKNFVGSSIGNRYVEALPYSLETTFEETSTDVPIFFILSPGVDPVKQVELLGKTKGKLIDSGTFKIVSLGQGQTPLAEAALLEGFEKGNWVMLENLHLVLKWLPVLEKILESQRESDVKPHPQYRVFLTAEPAEISPGILQSCIKVTNEPPSGIKAIMRRALDCFDAEFFEKCSKANEFKSILFALCFFHAVILERRKFGPLGWNIPYPFNLGDLTVCADVLFNQLEGNLLIPWADLQYIFGEIMYGGHISDLRDRELCKTYLEVLMKEDLFEEALLAPGFAAPVPSPYEYYIEYLNTMPVETPELFGLHPNAEIRYLTVLTNSLFNTIQDLQPRQGLAAGVVSREEKAREILEDILEKLPPEFDMHDLYSRVESLNPYISVCLQECDRMNILLSEIRRSLKEVALGLAGDLTISEQMDRIIDALFSNRVPDNFAAVAYPSLKPLQEWFLNLLERAKQLQDWCSNLSTMPSVLWLPGLFNPQSFLTAVMQVTARKNGWPLDKMILQTEVTKKKPSEITTPPREGAYIYGLSLEGARWDVQAGCLADAEPQVLFDELPVIYIKATTLDKRSQNTKDFLETPVYATSIRGPTFIWTFYLKTRVATSKWRLAGTALLLENS
ncbi:hypothetical protein RCL1_001186 [Eukaryota sp. TZLM3-RCL]